MEEAGDHVIARVQNLSAAKDGRIYILDSKNFKIHIFSKEGKFISAFGDKGDGPGEIRGVNIGEQLFVLDSSIAYADRGRIHYFALDGTYKKSFLHPASLAPSTFFSENVFISAPSVVRGPRGKKGKMILYNTNNKSGKIITEYDTYDKATDPQFGRSIVVENITPMMFVSSRQGKVYYGMSASYEIAIADITGKKIGSFSIDGRAMKNVSQNFIYSIKKELVMTPPDVADRILKALPKKASFFCNISIDKNGLVYIFISDPDSLNLQAFDIFSPQGKFLYSSEIKIEDGHTIRVIYLKDDLLLMAVEDEAGTVKVVKYLVKLPPAL